MLNGKANDILPLFTAVFKAHNPVFPVAPNITIRFMVIRLLSDKYCKFVIHFKHLEAIYSKVLCHVYIDFKAAISKRFANKNMTLYFC